MGVEYRQTPAILNINDRERRRTVLEEHRGQLRVAFGPFRHSYQVVALDGRSAATIEASDRVFATSGRIYKTLGAIAAGSRDPRVFFTDLHDYWSAIGEFVTAVRLEQSQ
ncbi:hypothetical protein GCM10018779_16780 [Streptomyces griseocarneus]|nr:hypothetical protein GCM10018779_16780 [Streptomyces griseocarneus]